ncbi:MAG: peptidylprolyl isomerase [Candidatus Eisenbacteria bacterium]|nr:peptidylprolyl isomerase [Candidatus Eisenbacteria bacterium]
MRDAAAPDAAPAFQDEIVRREARRILRAAGEDVGPEPPIETGRSPAEYGRIAAWAEQEHAIEIRTGGGTIEIRLFPHEAPLTCWNFVRLAESGYFDGSAWHRVVPDFVVQDGDPRGDGFGGPGNRIRCEIHKDRRYGTGSLGMALSGKDTGGSQFFLTHSPQPHLDGRYTVFGQVVSGQELVDRVAQGDRIDSIRAVSAVR